MKRPAASLVLITAGRLTRADLGSRGELRILDQVRPEVDDLAVLVDAALRQAPPGKDLWVLSSELWTQTLDLPAGSLLGAGPDELLQALKYEAEPLSGLGAREAVAAYRPGREDVATRSFWLVEATLAELTALEGVARRQSCRFRGLAHPGGLPARLGASAPSGAWRREERWPGVWFSVAWDANGRLDIAARPPGEDPEEAPQLLLFAPDEAASAGEEARIDLSEEGAREAWLRAWLGEARRRDSPVPWLRPPTAPLARETRQALALAGGVLMALLCWAHHIWMKDEVSAAERELERARAPEKQAAILERELGQLEREERELLAEEARLKLGIRGYRQALEAHRGRHAQLLACLAASPSGIWVERLGSEGRDTTLAGLSDHPHLPSQLATELAAHLAHRGWRVGAPAVEALRQRVDGGPWSFRIRLSDAPLPHSEEGAR